MKAVLLCAGYATRLYPLTENRPKSLLPVAGRPLLDHLLEKVEAEGSFEKIFLLTNERFYPDFKRWAEGKRGASKIEVVSDGTRTDQTRLGAVGDLAFAIRTFQLQDDLGVFAGDNLFHFDLRKFFSFGESHRPHVSLGVVDVESKERARHYGVVRIDSGGEGRLVEFFEKPERPPSTLASTGIYWLPKESLVLLDRYLREGHNADRFGDYIGWLGKVDCVFCYSFEGKWFDIGDLDSYREADQFFPKKFFGKMS